MEAEAASTDGGESFLEGETGVMTAIIAPLAFLSLVLCVCFGCRKKRQRDAASASMAARNSYKTDGEFFFFAVAYVPYSIVVCVCVWGEG